MRRDATRRDRCFLAGLADRLDAPAGIIGDGPNEIHGYHARLARLKGKDKVKVA